MAKFIEHTGIIKNIQNKTIQVLIEQKSACCDCDAKGACTVSDHWGKTINIESTDATFKIGDTVILYGKQSIGIQAVVLAFVIPFILILITLFILQSIVTNELISGAVALSVLVPYYIILSFFNKKLASKFKFEIKKDTVVE